MIFVRMIAIRNDHVCNDNQSDILQSVLIGLFCLLGCSISVYIQKVYVFLHRQIWINIGRSYIGTRFQMSKHHLIGQGGT